MSVDQMDLGSRNAWGSVGADGADEDEPESLEQFPRRRGNRGSLVGEGAPGDNPLIHTSSMRERPQTATHSRRVGVQTRSLAAICLLAVAVVAAKVHVALGNERDDGDDVQHEEQQQQAAEYPQRELTQAADPVRGVLCAGDVA
jgi:hypothetical protein